MWRNEATSGDRYDCICGRDGQTRRRAVKAKRAAGTWADWVVQAVGSGSEWSGGGGGEGPKVLGGGEQAVHRDDGAILWESRGIQAPPRATKLALSGLAWFGFMGN